MPFYLMGEVPSSAHRGDIDDLPHSSKNEGLGPVSIDDSQLHFVVLIDSTRLIGDQ